MLEGNYVVVSNYTITNINSSKMNSINIPTLFSHFPITNSKHTNNILGTTNTVFEEITGQKTKE